MSAGRVIPALARLLILALLSLFAVRAPAAAHDVGYGLGSSGDARVIFHYSDGTAMAGAAFRVFAPGGGQVPVASGLTDSAGQVSFRATRDGVWRVETNDTNGHASRARIEVTNGLPAIDHLTIPAWLAAASVSLNIALAVWFAFGRRSRFTAVRPPAVRDGSARGRSHQHGELAP